MACAAEGGYLAVVNSEVEAKALSELFLKQGIPMLYVGSYVKEVAHIGFHDWSEHGGQWMTIHGKTWVSYINVYLFCTEINQKGLRATADTTWQESSR